MNSLLIFRWIAGLIGCFLTTFLIIPYFISRAENWKLMDKPAGRKKHLRITPIVGGLSFFIAVCAGSAIAGLWEDVSLLNVFAFFFLLVAVGVIDDRKGLSALAKLLGQFTAVAILMMGGEYVNSFYGILGVPELSTGIMMACTFFFIAGLINAVNLLDGMDGLAGGIVGINAVIFGMLFYMRGNYLEAVLAFMLAAGLAAFLVFNFAPAKIFMGDAGSLFLGGALAYFFIKIWNNPRQTSELYLAVALISFPVFDMVRVFMYRLVNKRSPFSADRSHFHHYLNKIGLRDAVAVLVMYILNMLLILQAILLSRFGLDKFIISNLLFFLLLFFLVKEHSEFYKKSPSGNR